MLPNAKELLADLENEQTSNFLSTMIPRSQRRQSTRTWKLFLCCYQAFVAGSLFYLQPDEKAQYSKSDKDNRDAQIKDEKCLFSIGH